MIDDPLAPKINAGTFPKIFKEVLKRRERNGHRRPKSKVFTEHNRFCKICRKTWFKAGILVDPKLVPDICAICQSELDKGQVAVTCIDGRHAFIYSFSLAGQPSPIEVSKEVMDKVEEEAKKQQEKKDDDASGENTEAGQRD